MNWIVRLDRVVELPTRERSASVLVERSTRRWRVQEGDRLLLVSGHSLGTVFSAVADVSQVTHSETVDRRVNRSRHEYRVTVRHIVPIHGDVSLEEMMYSLTKVSNFTRPYLHFRRRTTIDDDDLASIQGRRIVVNRSIYFGLLRNLDPRWREWFDLRSQFRQVERTSTLAPRPDYEADPPVKDLLTLLETVVLTPMRLGRAIVSDWRDVFPDVAEVTAVGDDRSPEWQLLAFCRNAAARSSAIERGWNTVHDLFGSAPPDFETQRTWRPHRW
jgi:hypothetical protein